MEYNIFLVVLKSNVIFTMNTFCTVIIINWRDKSMFLITHKCIAVNIYWNKSYPQYYVTYFFDNQYNSKCGEMLAGYTPPSPLTKIKV